MLTLDPTSVCDVCGDQYGTVCLPYSVPCGHSFCRNCLDNIAKNAKGAACPLCREPFAVGTIRLIRVDLADPLPKLSYEHFLPSDDTDSDLSDRGRSPWNQETRIRDEARNLELQVAKVASQKSTFEEVSALQKTIQEWLMTDVKYKPNGKFAALRLSAALLRAILLNSLAYTENSKVAKSVENDLHEQIKAFQHQQTVYEAEVRRQKQQYSEKAHECAQLQAEVERLRRANPSAATGTRLHSSPFPGPSSPVTSSPPPSSASVQTPQARFTSPGSNASTPTSRIPPPRSVTTSPTRINPYAPTTLPSISSTTSSRSSSAASSASSSPSPAPAREFFLPSSGQTSPTPYSTRPVTTSTTAKTGVEALLVRPQQPAVPRSMTAPLPPQAPGQQPPPIRLQTRPRPSARYPQVWLPMIEDTDDTASESTHYSLGRSGTFRATATPTPTSIRR